MEGRKHQMSGYGRSDGNGCRLIISCFTDHYDIRILSQERPQSDFKGKARHIVDLHLIQLGHILLHGILYGGYVHRAL